MSLVRLQEEGFTRGDAIQLSDKFLNTTNPMRRTRIEDLNIRFINLFKAFHSNDYTLYENAKMLYKMRISI